MATLGEALQLVSLLESELIRRQTEIDQNNDYYRGKQPLKFASDDFAKFHGAATRTSATTGCKSWPIHRSSG
ncbi:hypothetical protein [Streptomyces sp. 11x1]|uniref:hypothetical protein n=1 Tax=Streptomyces sp. 11x1 TaxID=3038642 RepID=UPI0029308E37|nr:hypothetical protein [Streptomyces sp. 11x1]WNZ11637.1 hypothetical protein P8T65_31515 [Streptomyces sp. 11x1]